MTSYLIALCILSSSPEVAAPEPVPVQQPPAAAPAPAAEPAATGLAEPAFGGTTTAEGPAAAPAPAPVAAPADVPPPEDPTAGLGMLVAGPLTVAVGVPLSFAGNAAWRDTCGPSNTDAECATGSTLSTLAHALAGVAYAGGAVFTGVGAGKRGRYDATMHMATDGMTRSRGGFIAAGAVVLPAALIGMGMARLFYWLPTPDCQVYSCVQQYQLLSTVTVGACALLAAAGAGMLMYGAGYQIQGRRLRRQVGILPQAGLGYAGLGLVGRF